MISERYLFFLRHFNDLDNVTPVIHWVLEETSIDVTLVFYEDGGITPDDPNLTFLRDRHSPRLRLRNLSDPGKFGEPVSARSQLNRNLVGLRHSVGRGASRVLPSKAAEKLRLAAKAVFMRLSSRFPEAFRAPQEWIVPGQVNQEQLRNTIRDLLAHDKPSLIIFDHNRCGKIRGLVEAIRSMSELNIVTLPVSPLINYNVLRSKSLMSSQSNSFLDGHDYSCFDALALVDELWRDEYVNLMRIAEQPDSLSGRTHVLGSARYCREWIQTRQEFVVPLTGGECGSWPSDLGQTRLLFLLSNPGSNADVQEVNVALEMVARNPKFSVIVKPHTRFGYLGGIRIPQGVVVDHGTDTSSLLAGSEVALFWSTSAACEGYATGKFMVCLEYLSSNRNSYAHYDAGYVAHSRDDLERLLLLFPTRRDEIEYNDSGVRKFVSNVLEGGLVSTVKRRYLNYLDQYASDGA